MLRVAQICLCGVILSSMTSIAYAQSKATEGLSVKQRAVKAFKSKDYEKAAELFGELYMQTSNPNLLFNIGLCHHRSGAPTKALKSLKSFVKFHEICEICSKL